MGPLIMPVFDSSGPITLEIDLPVGAIMITASDRGDTVAQVQPTNASRRGDVEAAEHTLVEFRDNRLAIRVPSSWRRYSLLGAGPSVDITIQLPAGSALEAEGSWTSLRADGQLGDVRIATGGDIRVQHAERLDVRCSHGSVTVQRTTGPAHVVSSSGSVRITEAGSTAVVENSSGECWIGQTRGDVQARTSSGSISVDRAGASVSARTAYGTIRIGEIACGTVDLLNSYGGVDVGIRTGSAAWLDLSSQYGRVHQDLEPTSRPGDPAAADTVQLRAATTYGDIHVHRS